MLRSVMTFLTVSDFVILHCLFNIPSTQDFNPNLGCSGTPIWWSAPRPSGRLSLPVVVVGFQQRLPLSMAPSSQPPHFSLVTEIHHPSQPSTGLLGTGIRSWWEAQWDQPCPLEESPTLGLTPPDQQSPKFLEQEAEVLREGYQG